LLAGLARGILKVMREVNTQSFGYIIAFLLPGFITLAGLSQVSPTVAKWLGASGPNAPTIGGFLYGTLAAIGAGILASTVRWLLIDTLHHRTGISPPEWNYAVLQRNTAAFEVLKQDHYRFYQCYGNSMSALLVPWITLHLEDPHLQWFDGLFALLLVVFYLGSRDTLRKYYDRVRAALN